MMSKQKSRTDKFILNIGMSALLQVITVITGFITPKLMLLHFGSEINGLTNSIAQFISYIGLVEAGLSNATVFALYKPIATGDNAHRDAVISAARISYNNTGWLFVGLSLILAFAYPLIARSTELSYLQTAVLVLILCLNGTLNFFIMAKYRSLITADQCSYWISAISGLQYILHTLIIYVMINLVANISGGVVLVRGLAVSSIFISAILFSIIVKHKYGNVNFYAKPDMTAINKRSDAMFLQVMGVIQNGSPAIIITALINLSVVSVYSVYNMVVGTISTCIDVFTSGLASSFGIIKASGEEELLQKSNEQFRVSIFFFITVFYSVMLVMMIPFVGLYTKNVTDVQYIVPAFSFFITLYGLINAVRGPYGMLIYSFGKYKEIKQYSLIQTLIAVVGGVIFTKLWGITGIAIALGLSSLYMLIVMIWFTPKYLLPISVTRELGRIARVFTVVLGMYLMSRLVDFHTHTFVSWLVYATCTTILTVAVAFGVNYPFEKVIYRQVVQRIKRYVSVKLMRRQVKMEIG